MGGANRVDSHGFHEGEVLACPFLVENAALVGAHLVAVDAVEREGLPVRRQNAVLDAHSAESNAQGARAIDEAVLAFDVHASIVEGGVGGTPRAHAADLDTVAAVAPLAHSLEEVCEGPEAVDLQVTAEAGLIGTTHPSLDGRVTNPGLVVGVDPQILDRPGCEVTQAHRAEDAGQPPLILILEVGTRAELVDTHGDPVNAGAHGLGHVEFVGQTGAAGHANPRAVDPHADLTLDAVEAQGDDTTLPVCRKLEGATVVAHRVVLGREGRVDGEWEVDVGVGRVTPGAAASQDPVTGHVDRVRVVADSWLIPRFFNVHPGGRIGTVIDEGPGTVEADNAGIIDQMRARRQERSRTGSIGR